MFISKEILISLYINDKKSITEIAKQLGFSPHKVVYWLKKYGIPRRSPNEASYIKYNPNGDPFRISNLKTKNEILLYALAIGLFWGEGNKKNVHDVRIGNTDIGIINYWCRFLREICHVKEQKIHFHLQTFKNMSLEKTVSYWSRNLEIDPSRITSCKPMAPLGKGSYHKMSQFGVLTVGVYNTHFRKWIMEQLYNLGYNPD